MHPNHRPRHQEARKVLQLDIQGTPQAWITAEQAALHYATDTVAWEEGQSPLVTLRGGWNVASGRQSQLVIHPIIALRGTPAINLFDVMPTVTKPKLLRRDRYLRLLCAGVPGERSAGRAHHTSFQGRTLLFYEPGGRMRRL